MVHLTITLLGSPVIPLYLGYDNETPVNLLLVMIMLNNQILPHCLNNVIFRDGKEAPDYLKRMIPDGIERLYGCMENKGG